MTVPRELRITYGGFVLGGTTPYLIDGFSRVEIADGAFDSAYEIDVVVSGATVQEFVSRCNSLERAFRRPRQAFAVAQAGHTMERAAHDAAEGGFNTEPTIRKAGQPADTGRSRIYTISIKFQTPADTVTTMGLRDRMVNVQYDESRIRTVRISGVVTAIPGSPSARERYEAIIDGVAAAIKSALSVNVWNLQEEPSTEQDYDDKTIRFERVYREVIFGEGQDDAIDDADITKQTLNVSRMEFSEERSPAGGEGNVDVEAGSGAGAGAGDVPDAKPGNVQALAEFTMHYEASIDATRTTDLNAKYDTIRSWLLGQFTAVFAQGAFALVKEEPQFDRAANRIVVDMVAQGAVRGVDFVRRTITSNVRKQPGKVFIGVYTGNEDDHYKYQGFSNNTRTTTVVTRYLATKDKQQAEEANEAAAAGGGGGGGEVINSDTSSTSIRIGIEGSGHTIDMVDVTSVVTARILNVVNGTKIKKLIVFSHC